MLQTKFKYELKKRAITQNLGKQELQFICTALPLMRSIHQQNFITIAFIVLEICIRQNLGMKKKKKKKKQRAITQKLSKQELRFMCTALPLDEIYPPKKFHNHSNYSFGDMHWTKVKFESKQRAPDQKIKKKQTRVMVHVHCTPP